MPVIPNAHPNATVLAIAEKAAAMLRRRDPPTVRDSVNREDIEHAWPDH
jgi:hypothetical protein